MTEEVKELEMTRHALGRFTVELPEVMESQGEIWRIGHVDVIERAWLDNIPQKGRWFFWDQHMKTLEAIPIRGVNKDQPKPTIEVIEPNEEGLWYKQSLYYDHNEFVQRLKWDIFADMGNHAVWFGIDKYEDVKGPMGELLMEALNAYKPYSEEEIVYQPNVFYLEKGAIHLSYDYYERSRRFFGSDDLDYSLMIEIKTNKTDGDVRLIEHTRWVAKELSKEQGFNMDILRSGNRRVAGLEGEEILTRIQDIYLDEARDYIIFEFHYNGEFETPDKPNIRIKLEGSPDNLPEKIAIWDAMLNSIQYVGE